MQKAYAVCLNKVPKMFSQGRDGARYFAIYPGKKSAEMTAAFMSKRHKKHYTVELVKISTFRKA